MQSEPDENERWVSLQAAFEAIYWANWIHPLLVAICRPLAINIGFLTVVLERGI